MTSKNLFVADDIVSASGTEIPADGLIEIVMLDENGKAVVQTDLPMGSYYIQELATDEHYILNDEKYPVAFEYAGQETAKVVIAANDGEPIENDMFYGSVSGIKSDENGEIMIENLRIGEYTVSEVNNEASAMYILPDDKQATVKTGSTTIVEMHNTLRDTPKTGDNSNIGLWFALTGLSMIGAAACGIAAFRKKKKGENK